MSPLKTILPTTQTPVDSIGSSPERSTDLRPSKNSSGPVIGGTTIATDISAVELTPSEARIVDAIINSKPAFKSFKFKMYYSVKRTEHELNAIQQLMSEDDLVGNETSATTNITRLKSALQDAEALSALKKSRLATLSAYTKQATSALKNLTNTMQDEDVKEAITILQQDDSAKILQDVSPETVSMFEYTNTNIKKKPLQIPPALSNTMANEEVVEKVITEIDKLGDKTSKIAYVGLPAKLLETLRRDTGLILSEGSNEYIIVKIAKRHIIYSDIVFNPLTFAFSPQVEVALEAPSTDINLAQPPGNYFCYSFVDGWIKNSFHQAVRFIMQESNISMQTAQQIVRNHFLSSAFIEKLRLQNGISLVDACLTNINDNTIIKQSSKQFFDSVISEGIEFAESDFVDNLLIEEDDSFIVPEISSLSQEQITNIGAVEYRLLHKIASDAIFTGESIYKPKEHFPAFEKVYAVHFTNNDFSIDVEKTCASDSGKSMFEYLRKSKKISGLDAPPTINASGITQLPRLGSVGRMINQSNASDIDLDGEYFLIENEDNTSLSQFVVSIKLVKK